MSRKYSSFETEIDESRIAQEDLRYEGESV